MEKKVGPLTTPAGRTVRIVDLPGTYSLRARSPDEEVTRDIVLGRTQSDVIPDLIVCVADASNLRLALRLVLELKQVGRPVMLSLNMMDIARKRGIEIDIDKLGRELDLPVVSSVAVRRGGTDALLAERSTGALPPRRPRPARSGPRPTPRPCAAPRKRRIAFSPPWSRDKASPTASRRAPMPSFCIRWQDWSCCWPSCS